jgi:cytoskeleton protein RodZ
MPIEQASTEQQALEQETETAGSLLAEARKARGLDEKQVADQLHITVHYVKAIEADLYEKLPGAIFARGYIKSYANYLQLDVDDILSRYQAVAGQQQSAPTRIQTPVSSKPRRQRNLQWALASVGVFSAVIIAAWIINGDSGSSNEVAVTSTQSQGITSSQAENSQTEMPTATTTSSAELPAGQAVALAASAADGPAAEAKDSQQALLTAQADSNQTQPDSSADPQQMEAAASPAGIEPAADAEPESALAVTDSSPAASRQDVAASAVADSETSAAPQPGQTVADSGAITDSATPDVSAAGQTEASAESIVDTSDEPAGDAVAVARPEELAVINVMQGRNGERIIAVDANGEDVLRISFSGESWVEVNDSQARMVYRDLRQAGDVLEITGHAPFNILLGDAPLTSLRFNGDEIDVSDDIRIDNSARLTVGL